jgi:hypothetical protein
VDWKTTDAKVLTTVMERIVEEFVHAVGLWQVSFLVAVVLSFDDVAALTLTWQAGFSLIKFFANFA